MCVLLLGVAFRGSQPVHAHHAAADARPGHIEMADILLEPPEGHITAADCDVPARVWQLPGYSHAAFTDLLAAAGLEQGQSRALDAAVACGLGGCAGSPGDEILIGLRPAQRATLYAALGRFRVNIFQFYPFSRPARLGPWSAHRGLSPEVRALFDQLTYTEGNRLLFADMPLLCARLRDQRDSVPALESLMSHAAVAATLHLDAGTDLGAVVRYWAFGRAPQDVRSVLARARPDRGEARVDVAALLPPFARSRLNTFPRRSGPNYDCSWSALHFFDDAPDEILPSGDDLNRILADDYVPVPFEERRFGDIIRFSRPDGSVVHVANHVAGELVFTKNGASTGVPWDLQRLADVEWRYQEAPTRTVHRLRRLAGAAR